MRKQIDRLTEYIRNNQKTQWILSLLSGAVFYFAYSYSKKFWHYMIRHFIDYAASLIDWSSQINVVSIIIGVNLIVDLPAAFVASLLCAGLFLVVLKRQQFRYSLGLAAPYFILSMSRWHFMSGPDLGVMIYTTIQPFLVCSVLIFTYWHFFKFHLRRWN